MVVRWKKSASPSTITAPMPAAHRSNSFRSMKSPPSGTSRGRSGMPTSRRFTLLPHRVSPKPSRKKVSPMVAMKRMKGSWLTSGRSMTFSIAIASSTITPTVIPMASQVGTPRSCRPTRVRAAKSTMTPCAKLKVSEALKIRTKPSATSEYMIPVRNPFATTSAKNTGYSAMSTKGETKNAFRISMTA